MPHCAMAQEMCDKLWALKLLIFSKHSPAMAFTSCSFQSPHLANAHAVFESCRWSNPEILLTISAAMIDMSGSFLTPRDANPQTMAAMSCGVKCSARYFAMSAILHNNSTTMLSLICNLPRAKEMSARSLAQMVRSSA